MRMFLYRGSLIAAALGFWLICAEAKAFLPDFADVRDSYESSDGRLLDRNGLLLQEVRLGFKERSLDWVKLEKVSPSLREAIVEVEDRRFLHHNGVDWWAMLAAFWQRAVYGSRRGASTITMQMVSLLESEAVPRKGKRSLWAKVRQARVAWELEKKWTKNEILEAYLNLVTFRGEHRGISASSRALFRKDPHGLDRRESFLLAILLRAPGMSALAAGKRLCRTQNLGSCRELELFAATSLAEVKSPVARAHLAPHLARRLLSPEAHEVRSTLSLPLQRTALNAIQDQLHSLSGQNAQNAAVLVANNKTGEVLAYVSGSSSLSLSSEVDLVQSRRQAGSTLKPFLYALAFNKNYIQPNSWLLDEPLELALERGSYQPENYDHRFHGPVSAQVALASSLNIPAVRLGVLVGADPFRSFLDQLGFRSLEEGAHYGPSLALGTADVTLFDLVQAYMTLANDGNWRPLRFKSGDSIVPSKPLLTQKTSRQISAILSDRGFRALTFGWDSVLATPYSSAVKTGTSKDMRDNWCIGYSQEFTVGVWVGNSSGKPMWQVSGVSGAAPIWRKLMDHLSRGYAAAPFLVGTRPSDKIFDPGSFGRILYPVAGAVLALDPDIPEANQRIAFESSGGGTLMLNGSPIVDSLWKPKKGRHHLKLSSRSGVVLDSLSFEVR